VAERLGAGRHVLNACTDRYHFTVGFAATLVSGRLSLLPSTHTAEVIRQLRAYAPDVVCLTDADDCDIELPRVPYPRTAAASDASPPGAPAVPAPLMSVPAIGAAQPAACVFTSGSTGTPVPHRKSFGPLIACVGEEARRLRIADGTSCAIVATVPPQHMYGLESSVLMALANGHALCAERPFYPADIAAVLAAVPRPRILVSTPVHLRALLESGIAVPATDLIVCSTAPLAAPLAADIERRCATRLLEVYGSTETGQIALRRPTEGPEWRLWPDIKLSVRGEETWAQGGHIEQPTRLWDVLEVTGAGRFLLHGRVADLVNIAGKRSSLAYLDHQLNSIPGVVDGAFFHVDDPRAAARGVARVAACVVAPQLDTAQVVEELRRRIDPVFLPRPLVFVAQLPRNSTGKLPQEALRSLAAAHLKSA